MSEPGQRLRRAIDGQLGFLIQEESGTLMVRLDRGPRYEQLIPYRRDEWVEDTRRELTSMQIARISYEADRALRIVFGEYGVKEWLALREPEQQRWAGRPQIGSDETRNRLYEAILKALRSE